MVKLLLIISAALTGILTILSVLIFINRFNFPYDTEGNYFDGTSATVYHEQSVLVYGSLTLIMFLLSVLFSFLAIKKFRNKSKNIY